MADHPTISGDDAIAGELLTSFARLAAALRSHAWRDARARRLTPTQSQILLLLDGTRTPLRLNQVARALGVSAATASDAVSTLVGKGLVAKARNSGDVRSVAISLTDAGAMQARLSAEWPSPLIAAVQELSLEEQTELLRGVARVLLAFEAHGQIEPTIPPAAPGQQ